MANFFGVDGEMSAADLASGGRLIQIGVVAHRGPDGEETFSLDAFSSLINPGDMEWDVRAAGVHGFTLEEIRNAPAAADVDDALVDWLVAHGANTKHRDSIAVGYNVGAFDLPHIALVLPKTYSMFSRRSVDLNAICFTLEGAAYNGSCPSWAGWKRLATTYAERTICPLLSEEGTSIAAHDAGYDALMHLYAWRFLRAAVQGMPMTIPNTPTAGKEVMQASGALLASVGGEAAELLTGIDRQTLYAWSKGGRCADVEALPVLKTALAALG